MGDSDEEVQILRTDPGGRGVAGGDAVSAGARPPLTVGGSGSLRANKIAQRSAVPKKTRERPDVVLGEDDSLWSCSGVPAGCAWPCHVAVKSVCGLGWSCASCNDHATVAGQGSSMADSVITADHPRRPSISGFCGKGDAVSRLPAGSRMPPVIRVMRSPAAFVDRMRRLRRLSPLRPARVFATPACAMAQRNDPRGSHASCSRH